MATLRLPFKILPRLQSLEVTGLNVARVGQPAQFSVWGQYDDGERRQVRNNRITWGANTPQGQLLVPPGTDVSAGLNETVSATVGNITAFKVVPVLAVRALVKLVGMLGPALLYEGTSGSYTPVGEFADGTTGPVVGLPITWSVNAPGGVLAIAPDAIAGNDRVEYVSATVAGSMYATAVNVLDVSTGGQLFGLLPYDALAPTHAWITGTLEANFVPRFFNGITDQDSIPPYRTSDEPNPEVVMTFPRGWFLGRMRLFDGKGTAAGNGTEPLAIYYRTWDDDARVLLTSFTGTSTDEWLDWVELAQLTEIRELLVVVSGNRAMWFTQMQLDGAYPNAPLPAAPQKFFAPTSGMNSYDYNVRQPGVAEKLGDFETLRYYAESHKIIRPDGIAFFDADQMLLANKATGRNKVLFVFNGNTEEQRQTWPDPTGMGTMAMFPYNADKLDPETWRVYGTVAFQSEVRWGYGNHALSAVQGLVTTGRWTGDPIAEPAVNLGLVDFWAFGNEVFGAWHGAARLTPDELATFLAVVWDGYGNTMGPGVGLKNANPNARMVLDGDYKIDASTYLKLDKSFGKIYGFNNQGHSTYYPGMVAVHDYPRDADGKGVPYERSDMPQQFEAVLTVLHAINPDIELIITEVGHTRWPEAGLSYVEPANGLTSEQRRAAWLIGMYLWFSTRLSKVVLYDDYDHALRVEGVLAQWDHFCQYLDTLSQAWTAQFFAAIGPRKTVAVQNIERDLSRPFVFELAAPGYSTMYAVFATSGITTPVSLSLPNGGTRYDFAATGTEMLTTPLPAGSITLIPSEVPCFILVA